MLKDFVLQGKPIDSIPVIDCHNHLGRWSAFHIPYGGGIDQMIANMNRLGMDKVFIAAHSSIGPDFITGNEQVAQAALQYPQRVMGYITVNPNYPSLMRKELEKYRGNPAFLGIKTHPGTHNSRVDSADYQIAYSYAEKYHLPVLVHVWGNSGVLQMDAIAASYPNISFIMAHAGGNVEPMKTALKVAAKHENIYLDTAVSSAPEGNIEWFCQEVDHRKILFGTDMPFYSPDFTLSRIAMANISEQQKQDILSGNILRILKQVQLPH